MALRSRSGSGANSRARSANSPLPKRYTKASGFQRSSWRVSSENAWTPPRRPGSGGRSPRRGSAWPGRPHPGAPARLGHRPAGRRGRHRSGRAIGRRIRGIPGRWREPGPAGSRRPAAHRSGRRIPSVPRARDRSPILPGRTRIIPRTAVTTSPASDDQHLAQARAILARHPVLDGHNDLPWEIRKYKAAPGDLAAYDLHVRAPAKGQTDLPRLRAGGVGGQFWSVYVPGEGTSGRAVLQLEQLDLARRMIDRYPDDLAYCTTADEVDAAMGAGKIASLLGMEGGHVLEGSLGALRAFYALGARYLTLTHNQSNELADSATGEVAARGPVGPRAGGRGRDEPARDAGRPVAHVPRHDVRRARRQPRPGHLQPLVGARPVRRGPQRPRRDPAPHGRQRRRGDGHLRGRLRQPRRGRDPHPGHRGVRAAGCRGDRCRRARGAWQRRSSTRSTCRRRR